MLTRWNDPFKELQTFQNRMNRLFSEVFSDFGTGFKDEGLTLATWAPPVDVAETPEHLLFTIELPGFKQEDLTLHAENGVLTLEGERKFEEKKEGTSYHRVERAYGKFVRSFALPVNVDAEKIAATLTDGVLRIELAKKEEAKPKSIPIGGGPKQIGGKKAA